MATHPQQQIDVGDVITFRFSTRRRSDTTRRTVRNVDWNGRPRVFFAGRDNFLVDPRDITAIEKRS